MRTHYELLGIGSTATTEEVKRAFRREIARYHPDKVQHLGKEFQEMAAERAAALTEAYRTLMNAELRAEYDRVHGAAHGPAAVPAAAPQGNRPVEPPPQTRAAAGQAGGAAAGAADGSEQRPPRFASERRDRDDFVRKAILDRFRQALAAELGQVEALPARGFDADFATRSKKLFSRDAGHRFAVKVVPHVDRQTVKDAWTAAQKAQAPICVFLMGSGIAPIGELAEAIGELRKRTRTESAISVVPIDLRDWSAHIPADAPASCRNVLKRLRDASVV